MFVCFMDLLLYSFLESLLREISIENVREHSKNLVGSSEHQFIPNNMFDEQNDVNYETTSKLDSSE